VRYVLLFYGDIEAPAVAGLRVELAASGELAGGEWLAAVDLTRTVRVRGGATEVTGGPYADADAGEPLAGYLLVDCATPERAAEIAARVRGGAGVEIRLGGTPADVES
jgi:hypothetical protein